MHAPVAARVRVAAALHHTVYARVLCAHMSASHALLARMLHIIAGAAACHSSTSSTSLQFSAPTS